MEEELPVFVVGSVVLVTLGFGVWMQTENWLLFALSLLIVVFFAFRLLRSRQQMRNVFRFFAGEANEMDPYHAAQFDLQPPTLRDRAGQWFKEAVSSKPHAIDAREPLATQMAFEGLEEQTSTQS
jgi:hypothetical protein